MNSRDLQPTSGSAHRVPLRLGTFQRISEKLATAVPDQIDGQNHSTDCQTDNEPLRVDDQVQTPLGDHALLLDDQIDHKFRQLVHQFDHQPFFVHHQSDGHVHGLGHQHRSPRLNNLLISLVAKCRMLANNCITVCLGLIIKLFNLCLKLVTNV